MENMPNKENLFFDPSTGKLCTSKPANDKAIAVDMNRQGSGGFFVFIAKRTTDDLYYSGVLTSLRCAGLN